MRDLLLASMQRLVLQHSDGPQAVDDDALWRDAVEAGFTRARLGDEDVHLSDVLAVVSLATQFGARAPIGDVLMADWLLCRIGASDAPACMFAVESDFQLRDGSSVTGAAHNVAGVLETSHLLSIAQGEGAAANLVVVELASARVEPAADTLSGRRHNAFCEGVPARAFPTELGATDIRAIAALARCAEMNGAMSRILDIVIEHAGTRVQFGKPLAKLQAVQQLQAFIAGQLAISLAAVDRVANAGDLGAVAFFSAMAKAVVSESAGKVAAAAHQILGAMGISREHELQHHTRALWAWRDEIGAEDHWRAVIGRRVLQAGGAALWPALVRT